MEIEYTIRIREKHNPPEFKEGLGKGVVAIQSFEYKKIKTEKDLNEPSVQRHIFEFSKELLEDWFEVIPTVIKKKEKKEKKEKMNIEYKAKRREVSRKNLKRFYTSLDMAIVKKDAANRNGQIKRGEVPNYPNRIIYACSCGAEGCFMHVGFEIRNENKKVEKTNNKIDWKSVEFLDNYLKEKENDRI